MNKGKGMRKGRREVGKEGGTFPDQPLVQNFFLGVEIASALYI